MRRLLLGLFLLLDTSTAHEHVLYFEEPIDAISFGVDATDLDLAVCSVSCGINSAANWHVLEVETEFDPMLRETNLVMFPEPVTKVAVRGSTRYEAHPIRVSHDPVRLALAAELIPQLTSYSKPKILTRAQWGADDNLLFRGAETARSDVQDKSDNGPVIVSERVKQCEEDQRTYAYQFKTSRTVTEDTDGNTYRWPQRYSPDIKLLVVHHTAMSVSDDERPAVERMRALYKYHADSRAWGDIGYHYVIDENGQIYEGRAGGKNVVGGHVYCGNVGTIGIALMGNFQEEKPTQNQMKSLQWLLDDLANEYNIDVNNNVSWRGKNLNPIVGHRDLIATLCPGYYVTNTITQVRRNVITGDLSKAIVFPTLVRGYQDRTAERLAARLSSRNYSNAVPVAMSVPGLSAVGSTTITGRPGGDVTLSLRYRAGSTSERRRARIGEVIRSNRRIGIWQTIAGRSLRVRNDLFLPESLLPYNVTDIRLRVQLPTQAGTYSLDIGELTFVLKAEGRRVRTVTGDAVRMTYNPADSQTVQTPGYRAQSSSSRRSVDAGVYAAESSDDNIRIRLSYPHNVATVRVGGDEIRLGREGNDCLAIKNNQRLDDGIVRLGSDDVITTIESWETANNRFRGIIECQIVDGQFTLINELSLEDYMKGLAEEPDTEPYEKQKAFAIAARSYAAYYMDEGNPRKFPGMPYDGDDSPAHFQKYAGVTLEEQNPKWVRAVEETAGKVLMKDGDVIKAAYFSSDDGRTRSPEENGWNGFPHSEVFQSKSDPWCAGMTMAGHGVGMSGCGAEGLANEGKNYRQILNYYYTGTRIESF